jgi:vanillate monooxygenase ferredoxin subunit
MEMSKVTIAKRFTEAEDIVSLELVALDGERLPRFSAGAHVDVAVKDGLLRQYSLCNSPEDTSRYVIAVLRDANSRGGSAAVHDLLTEGKVVEISEPRNHFPLAHNASSSVLVAGGIGITPILCMADRLHYTGVPFQLHYCGRSRNRMAFDQRIEQGAFSEQARLYFDDVPTHRFDASTAVGLPEDNRHLYVCGPSGFIEHVLATARLMGWSDANLHREFFGAAEMADTQEEEPFEVEIASTGCIYDVPVGRSVLQILSEHGIELPASCEQGVCGTCITRILSGQADHRDVYLTDEERAKGDQFAPCCSRSKSARLVLDL